MLIWIFLMESFIIFRLSFHFGFIFPEHLWMTNLTNFLLPTIDFRVLSSFGSEILVISDMILWNLQQKKNEIFILLFVFFLNIWKKAMDSYLLMYHEFQNSSLILWYNRFTMELSYFQVWIVSQISQITFHWKWQRML